MRTATRAAGYLVAVPVTVFAAAVGAATAAAQPSYLVRDVNADICPGECASRPSWLTTLLPDKLLFVADDGVHDKELWMSDGTAAGTVLLWRISRASMG